MTYQTIGTRAWAQRTGGRLSWRERITLLRHSLAPTLLALGRGRLHPDNAKPLRFEQVAFPDTPAVKSALDELEGCATGAVIQHSLRTYYWGAALGQLDGVDHDPEFLLVGCLLHDLGMTHKHHGRHDCHCFAVDGARAAEAWAGDFGWPANKQQKLGEMISLHLNGPVDPANGHEAHLLQAGAACDLIGARYFELARAYRDTVLDRHPRLDLNRVFTDFIDREAALRPDSRGALMKQVGGGLMIRLNPYRE